MAFDPNKLNADFKTQEELDLLAEIEKESVKDALHQEQRDDLSKETSSNVKLFFDYMALHVLIPCINALNRAVLSLRGSTSTSLETLEKKLTELSGDTTTSVAALDERLDSVEKVSAVSTAKVEAATELAKAAVENVMKKDQCASVMDLIKGTPLYFGTGTGEEIEQMASMAPGEAIFFNEDYVDYETLVKHPVNEENPHNVTYKQVGAAPGGFGLGEDCLAIVDWDLALQTGFYQGSKNSPNNGSCYGYVIKHNNDYLIQHAFWIDTTYGGAHHAIRSKNKSDFSEWEYENPPMSIGVEYRTTEKYMGKPVYTVLLSVTNAANESLVAPDNFTQIIRHQGKLGSNPLPLGDFAQGTQYAHSYFSPAGSNKIVLCVTDGFAESKFTWYEQIWYTKD